MKGDRRRNWSEIPSDLLVSVAEHLHLADMFRLPAVCGGWALALGILRRGCTPSMAILQTTTVLLDNSSPWLLLPNEDGVDTEYRDFLRLSKCKSDISRIRIYPLPEMIGRICVGGSPNGWIVTLDVWFNPRILNPITREEFLLPNIFTLSPYKTMNPIYSDQGDGSLNMVAFTHPFADISFENFKYKSVQKIILSSSPPLGIAFLIHNEGHLAMARVGDLAWTWALYRQRFNYAQIEDVVYNEKDDKFYVISTKGQVIVFNLKNYHWGSFQPPKATFLSSFVDLNFSDWEKYIVFSSSGDLLKAYKQTNSFSLFDETKYVGDTDISSFVREETICIEIFKFDQGQYDSKSPSSCWVHVNDLGDEAIFLGSSYSTCLTTSNKPWLRKNSVYFVEDKFDSRDFSLREFTCDGGIFDLKDKKIERFFPSHSKVNWPLPAWFFPSRLQLVL